LLSSQFGKLHDLNITSESESVLPPSTFQNWNFMDVLSAVISIAPGFAILDWLPGTIPTETKLYRLSPPTPHTK
jgi:hypothetical protein